jgi:hypothetical protein
MKLQTDALRRAEGKWNRSSGTSGTGEPSNSLPAARYGPRQSIHASLLTRWHVIMIA